MEPRRYPVVFDDGKGCIHGRSAKKGAEEACEKIGERITEVERKVDRMTWVLVLAAVAFAADVLGRWLLP